jgi:hypothetical protein
VLIAILSGAAMDAHRYVSAWTPLQRIYLKPYIRSTSASALGFETSQYQLLYVTDRQGRRLALNEEVQPVTTDPSETTFTLSDAGMQAGDRGLVWQDAPYAHAKLRTFLAQWIYRDQSLADLAMPALWTALIVFAVGLVVAIPKDVARARARRHGRRLKGPELVTGSQFNRRLRADGIGFVQVSPFIRRAFRRPAWIRLPRAVEASHLLIMGDTGAGKSSLIRQILRQIEDRGDTAIVYDPSLEYTPQFYTPERGDLILNPLDTRCPYWTPGDELRHDAEALALATSLFPDKSHENSFFVEAPRRIFAHLLTFRPSAAELACWLCDAQELDRRMEGTPYAAMIDKEAAGQRSGVRAALNMVADALKLVPAESDTTERWSAARWADTRRGWLFLTSTPVTREALRPLMSLWLDMLVIRLMTPGQPLRRPVWFVLDELASLQRLPQLHTAVTENRKSGNPVVLGFQGRSQLETRYGHDAEAMLSQPATKIFLRTTEAHAAEWISDMIGDVEIERLRESRSNGPGKPQSYGLERQVEPLVMASEISGLADLRGYLKHGNLVVPMHVPYLKPPDRHPGLIERPSLPPPIVTSPIEVPTATEPPAQQITPPDTLQGHEWSRSASGHGQEPSR